MNPSISPRWSRGLPREIADSARLISLFYFSFQTERVLHREIPIKDYCERSFLLEEACHHVLMGNQKERSHEWICLRADIKRNLTVLAKAGFRCWTYGLSEFVYARVYGDRGWSRVAIALSDRDRTLPILHDKGWRKILAFSRNDHIYRRCGTSVLGTVDENKMQDILLRDLLVMDEQSRAYNLLDPAVVLMQVSRTLHPNTLSFLKPEFLTIIRKLMPDLHAKIPTTNVWCGAVFNTFVTKAVKTKTVRSLFP